MPKILLTILLFLVFFFPSSKVFAACPTGEREYCPCGTSPDTFGSCANASGGTTAPVCRSTPFNCAAPATTTTGPSTSGSGQPCDPKATDLASSLAGKGGIYTAIGCIPTEPKALVEGLLKYGTIAAGAIAFILMLLGALGLITAEGNPEAIKHSQETFYSAIVGLLLIIFSVLLMQVIGVDILGLPEFGR